MAIQGLTPPPPRSPIQHNACVCFIYGGGEGGWNIRTSIALQYTVFLNLFYDREVIIILNYPKDLHNTKHENEILPNKILSFLILKKICFHLT